MSRSKPRAERPSIKASIRVKHLGSAALLIALLIVVGLVGVQALSRVAHESHATFENATKPLASMGIARAKLNEQRAFTNSHMLESTSAGKDDVEAKMAENEELINTNLAAVEESLQTEKGKIAFAALEESLAAYREARAKTLKPWITGSQGDASVRSRDEIDEIAKAFEGIIAYNGNMSAAARRIAEGDLSTGVTPKSKRDALGPPSRP